MACLLERMVRRNLKIRRVLVVLYLAALSAGGCASQGDHIALQLRVITPDVPPATQAGDLTVAIAAFEDVSPQKGHLGVRSHLWGGVSRFDLSGGKPGEVMAKLVGDYLKNRGWKVVNTDSQAQVVISGKILELSVDAKSSFGSTDITTATRAMLEAANAADGSKVRMTLAGKGSQDVFWFDPEDAEALLGMAASASLNELIVSTKVEDSALRMK